MVVKDSLGQTGVGIGVDNISGLLLCMGYADAGSRDVTEQLKYLLQWNARTPGDIHHFADRRLSAGCEYIGFNHICHRSEIANLASVAVDGDGLVVENCLRSSLLSRVSVRSANSSTSLGVAYRAASWAVKRVSGRSKATTGLPIII